MNLIIGKIIMSNRGLYIELSIEMTKRKKQLEKPIPFAFACNNKGWAIIAVQVRARAG